jgi:hypothetical protein
MSVRTAACGVIGLLLTLAIIRSGYGCQCGVRLPPAEFLDKSVAVFAGTVNDIRSVRFESVSADRASVALKEVRFTANRIWRGSVGSNVVLLMGSSDCDYPFEQGRAYLVYADGVDSATGYLTASICSPTKRLALATEDVRLLHSSRQLPKPLFRPEPTDTRLPLIALFAAAIGGAVAATTLLQWLRRSRHRHRSRDG